MEPALRWLFSRRHTQVGHRAGHHACQRALDALHCADGPIACRVSVSGKIFTVVATHDATKILHEFAIACAEQALTTAGDPDPRCAAAIGAKRAWLRGEINDAQLAAARAEALDAALDAARAAARESPANRPRWRAAEATARAAGTNADEAAYYASIWTSGGDAQLRAAQNTDLEARLLSAMRLS